MNNIIPSLLKLWDKIETELSRIVNKNSKRYGLKEYSKRKEISEKGKEYLSLFGSKKLGLCGSKRYYVSNIRRIYSLNKN